MLPHLRHKVVTDNRDAAAVLKWAVLEMQDRYELLAANGARNIQDFNRKVQEGQKLKNVKRINPEDASSTPSPDDLEHNNKEGMRLKEDKGFALASASLRQSLDNLRSGTNDASLTLAQMFKAMVDAEDNVPGNGFLADRPPLCYSSK